MPGYRRANFPRLALAHQQPGMPVPAFRGDVQGDVNSRGTSQFAEFTGIEALGAPKLDIQEYSVAPGRETIEEQAPCPLPQPGGWASRSPIGANRTLRDGTTVEIACLYTI